MHQPFLLLGLALWSIFRFTGYIAEPRLSDEEIHRVVVGEPLRDGGPSDAQQLTIVTWNIQRGVQFEKILTTLRAVDADILLLQEVDSFCRRSGSRHVARDLAAALGMNWVSAGEFQEIGEGRRGMAALSGQAILSKYQIVDPTVIAFAAQARFRWRFNPAQPRRGGRIALRARTGGLLIYNAHIESGGGDTLRRRQLDELVADQAGEPRSDQAVIIAGDFNNIPARRSTMFDRLSGASFVDALGADERRRTTTNREHAVDWIFLKNLATLAGTVTRVEGASDHYPVVATVARTR
jgi:endonuclease/exonuclease/phosphatase family metal-dependent hydrolase